MEPPWGVRINWPSELSEPPELRGDVILLDTALYDASTGNLLSERDARSRDSKLSPDGRLLVVTREPPGRMKQAEWFASRDLVVLCRFDLKLLEALPENMGDEGAHAWVDTVSNVAGVACIGVRPLYDCDSDSEDLRRWYLTRPDGSFVKVHADRNQQPLAFSRDASALLLQRHRPGATPLLTVVGRDGTRLSRLKLDSAPQLLMAVRPDTEAFTLFFPGGTVLRAPHQDPEDAMATGLPISAPAHCFHWWASTLAWTASREGDLMCAYHHDGHVCLARVVQGNVVVGRVPLATSQDVHLSFDERGDLHAMYWVPEDNACFAFRYSLRDLGYDVGTVGTPIDPNLPRSFMNAFVQRASNQSHVQHGA